MSNKMRLLTASIILVGLMGLALVFIPLGLPNSSHAQVFATNTPPPPNTTDDGTTAAAELVTVRRNADEIGTLDLPIVEVNFERGRQNIGPVDVVVANNTAETQSIIVWYLLSIQDPERPVWETAAFVAPDMRLDDIAPGSTVTLTLPQPNVQLDGDYVFSAWVHHYDPATDTREHADGFIYSELITVGPPYTFSIDHVDVLQEPGAAPDLVFVTFTINNNTGEETELGYSYSLSIPEDTTPWDTGFYTMDFQFVTLHPDQSITVTARHEIALPNVPLVVTGYLHTIIDGIREQQSLRRFDETILAE